MVVLVDGGENLTQQDGEKIIPLMAGSFIKVQNFRFHLGIDSAVEPVLADSGNGNS